MLQQASNYPSPKKNSKVKSCKAFKMYCLLFRKHNLVFFYFHVIARNFVTKKGNIKSWCNQRSFIIVSQKNNIQQEMSQFLVNEWLRKHGLIYPVTKLCDSSEDSRLIGSSAADSPRYYSN